MIFLCAFAPWRLGVNFWPVKTRKTWREKLADDKGLPKVGRVEGGKGVRSGEGLMVIPAPREVDALMKTVPRGKVTTINELRAALAKKHQADFTCPITTGIFSWIAANAAAEDAAAGRKRVTPYWRTLKMGGEVNPKYPGGVAALAKLLRAEGHTISERGKRTFVADFQARLFSPRA
ncbi:MAG: hypothetical protein EXS35_14185 [Pedosphaera sp.]|nr:hypothetical protein [Pedosphaera sp.]